MRAVYGAPWRALRRAGAGLAHRQRARDMARRIVAQMEREPVAGYVGVAFMLSAALALGALYLLRQAVPFVADLAREMAVMGAVGAGLFVSVRLVRWRSR